MVYRSLSQVGENVALPQCHTNDTQNIRSQSLSNLHMTMQVGGLTEKVHNMSSPSRLGSFDKDMAAALGAVALPVCSFSALRRVDIII